MVARLILLLLLVTVAIDVGSCYGDDHLLERRGRCVSSFCKKNGPPCCGRRYCHCFGGRRTCKTGVCKARRVRRQFILP
ncbi:hypothetical protein SNE40_016735 [Patella caerulea]|uniref:Uncharacterized protein n=1 Tax=Patella caerulea TaxID=87958 RepID=A0AAN8PNZ5_PATCE